MPSLIQDYYDNYVFQNNIFYIRNVSANREEFLESIKKFDSPKLFDISPLSPSGFPLYESNVNGYLSGFSYINSI
jgi:hypothetical protein